MDTSFISCGIVISEEGTGFLRRTKIEYAETGLVGEKMSNNGSVYRGNANRIELQEVVIRFSSDDGIRLRENIEPVLLSNVEINDNEGFGADIEGVGLVYIDNGVIANNIQGGVKRIGGFIELSNTEMVGNGEFGGANLTLGPKVFGKIIDNKLFRRYEFKSFMDAIDFINKVAEIAEKMDHHPLIRNVYNSVCLLYTSDAADE